MQNPRDESPGLEYVDPNEYRLDLNRPPPSPPQGELDPDLEPSQTNFFGSHFNNISRLASAHPSESQSQYDFQDEDEIDYEAYEGRRGGHYLPADNQQFDEEFYEGDG